MTVSQLQAELIRHGVAPDSYSLTGGLPNEAYCLSHDDGQWQVYYSERGARTGLKTFDNQQDACDYFYCRLVR